MKKHRFNHKLFLINLAQFIFIVTFIMFFNLNFGEENSLVSVAIVVAVLGIRKTPFKTPPLITAVIFFFIFVLCGLVPIVGEINIYVAFFVNLIFLYFTMRLTAEPFDYMPHITFVLCFLFCQSTQVIEDIFVIRMIQLLIGGFIVFALGFIQWRREPVSERITFKQQYKSTKINHSYIIRMTIGMAVAILLSEILGTARTLWISVVVMSLTQVHHKNTFKKIKLRLLATVVGILFFLVVMELLVPTKYTFVVILSLGFIGMFFTDYHQKQFINTISAINASLVLFDTSTAIFNRVTFLFIGIAIVLLLNLIEYLINKLRKVPDNDDDAIIENKIEIV